jgi:hypothetical protein
VRRPRDRKPDIRGRRAASPADFTRRCVRPRQKSMAKPDHRKYHHCSGGYGIYQTATGTALNEVRCVPFSRLRPTAFVARQISHVEYDLQHILSPVCEGAPSEICHWNVGRPGVHLPAFSALTAESFSTYSYSDIGEWRRLILRQLFGAADIDAVLRIGLFATCIF